MEAREAVVAELEREGRIVAREEYEHEVPYSHRSGERIEPLISLQWFMSMDELAGPAAAAVRDGRVRIVPENHQRVYLDWMENIRPWCISRQLWWGHRLPVYYCETCGHVNVALAQPDGCSACGGHVRQEEDVLDTWFSSALWPFATLGWPEQTPELKAFYPTKALSTARDILFLWVARMIMMGLELTGEVPFSEVYIHSVIQAPDGRRMSKSLGTGIDPVDEIERHGADAVRFGLLAMSSAQDVRYSAEKIQQGQALANKLFNAARFVLMRIHASLGSQAAQALQPAALPTAVEDRWILSRLAQVEADTATRIEGYDFSHAALGLYDFVYGELCDWYLELVKHRLPDRPQASEQAPVQASGDEAPVEQERLALAATLMYVLRETVAMAHPLIPFVTEELWSYLDGSGELLAGAAYPRSRDALIDREAEVVLQRMIEAVTLVRGWRDSVGARAGLVVPARLRAEGYEATSSLLARSARLTLSEDALAEATAVASIPVPGGTVEVLSGEGLDLGAAERRRAAAREKLLAEINRVQGKLSKPGFVEKAPSAVVDGERERLERLRAELQAL
jgi:valyl-tRNA synthetase